MEYVKKFYYENSDFRYKIYYKDKELSIVHRENAPAIIWYDNEKWWFKDGKRHRADGPAIERGSGYKEFYLNDVQYKEEDYWAIIKLGGFV